MSSNSQTNKATLDEINTIVRNVNLLKYLPNVPVQLSIPMDGNGIRIKVSVEQGQILKHKFPDVIDYCLNEKDIEIQLDVVEDYQTYLLY